MSEVQLAMLDAHARTDDSAAMENLLAPLPPAIAADVREAATPAWRGKVGMRYDAETRKAFWVAHDRTGVLHVWTLCAVESAIVAAKIWAKFDKSGADPRDESKLLAIYCEVTGYSVEGIQ